MPHKDVFYTCEYDENGVACGAALITNATGWIPRKNGINLAKVPGNAMPCYIARVGYYIGFGITRSEARANARYCMRFTQVGNLEVSMDLMQRWINNDFEYDDTGFMVDSSGADQRRESAWAVYQKFPKQVIQPEW